MTERVLFLCDGAPIPAEIATERSLRRRSLDWRSTSANLNLRAENLWDALVDEVDGRAADLVRIASCIYGADQEVSRGGPTDLHGTDWRRELHLAIPVVDLAYWSNETTRDHLQLTLNFATGDTWRFWFSPYQQDERSFKLQFGDRQLLGNPNCVVLFSGGADSLCATAELITQDHLRPLLVSHRPSPVLDSRQRHLVQLIVERARRYAPAHISFWVHRKGSDAADFTQRSRGFLFASLGAALAGHLGLTRVVLPDNGVVSVNLPINGQIVGTMASRSTHPKFLWHFNRLIASMFATPVQVENTLEFRTRPDVLTTLRTAGWDTLLQETVSCSHPRGRTTAQPHCGQCSQCVDRRFGTIAAGLEEHDLAERYQLDVFTKALPEGEARTLGESYVRFARWVRRQEPQQLFIKLSELSDALVPDCPNVPETADALAKLHLRHAASVVRVLSTMFGRYRDELGAGDLPATCLLLLAGHSPEHPADAQPTDTAVPLPDYLFRRQGRVWHVNFHGHDTWVEDTVGTRQLAQLLREPHREFDVLDLVEHPPTGGGQALSREDRAALGTGGTRQELVSDQTRANYRARLRELAAERAAAEREGDESELARINAAYERIDAELTVATGFGGLARAYGTDREKARQAVRRSIKQAIQRVADVHPDLGHHLERTVTTGWLCAYRPEQPPHWTM
jgi:7-cyano-7-deazaguanine synthase in queuosine biosynthesis